MSIKRRKIPISNAVHNVAPKPLPRLARSLRAAAPPAERPADPISELRQVVRQHKYLTQLSVRTNHAVSDRKDRETGETIKTLAPPQVVLDAKAAAESAKKEADRLRSSMRRLLRGIPVYDEFLSHVPGVGEVTASYLVTMVRIDRCPNVSNLIRYCGYACSADGKSERRSGAPKFAPDGSKTEGTGTFNQTLKIVLRTAFCQGMRMPWKGPRASHKYLRRWEEAKHSALTVLNPRLGRVMRDGEADDKGRRKATDLFLWDLYVMWRTLEGLPIRPDKYSAVRGRYHNGQEAKDAQYMLALDEAKEIVGHIVVSQEAAAE